ncbi:uncharacterized protein BXZ73DRAFT_81011 [Epithele typhae]|uniref:uncharacterized protein n=1 Tax=Epithele typhae TaxID=378194 RepID=UPI0020077C86|nr:uncharacterized protein BXZ73DRAFT_81011 [Epithele typhae]KAH9916771.1 hypothetical protein BXZ73DRAFT_81011 [Epithele typhae]
MGPPGQLYWGPIEKTEADFPQKFQPKKLLKLEGEDYVRLAAIHTVTKERLRRLELSEMENWRKETEKAREKETMKDYMERVENRVHLVGKLLIELPLIQTRCRMETSSECLERLAVLETEYQACHTNSTLGGGDGRKAMDTEQIQKKPIPRGPNSKRSSKSLESDLERTSELNGDIDAQLYAPA